MPVVFMNLYKTGYYHRAGKPGTLGVHPGDLYATEAEARAAVGRAAPVVVVAVPVALHSHYFESNAEQIAALTPYPADSIPRPLRETREFRGALEKGDGDYTPMTPAEVRAAIARVTPSHIEGLRPLTAFEMRAEAAELLGLTPKVGEGYNPGEQRPPEPAPLQCLPPAGISAFARFFSKEDAKLFRPLHEGYPGTYDEGSAV